MFGLFSIIKCIVLRVRKHDFLSVHGPFWVTRQKEKGGKTLEGRTAIRQFLGKVFAPNRPSRPKCNVYGRSLEDIAFTETDLFRGPVCYVQGL